MGSGVRRFVLAGLFVLIVASLSFGAGFGFSRWAEETGAIPGLAPAQPPADINADFNVFWQAWRVIERDYVDRDKLDRQKMIQGAIKGLVESLGDPHSSYVSREQYQRERLEMSARYEGIGAFVERDQNNFIVIVAPIEGSPAEKAGLKPGDRILRVNGEDIRQLSLDQAVAKIKGPRGTKVTLTIAREGQPQPFDVEVVRSEVRLQTVSTALVDGYGYVRISVFSEVTNEELVGKLRDLLAKNPKGLILDLRNNPGGLLGATVDVTGQFLREGIVLYEVDGRGNRRTWQVRPGGVATDIPLVVLVNRGSASGSEVLAGALKDHRRAVLIGEETFGKGSVNTLRELSDGSAVYITIARWLTPNGNQIDGKGLAPDIPFQSPADAPAPGTNPQQDPAVRRAIAYFQTGQ
ncbi:MAG: S41 family peptidase [Chloroflexota bacterium]